MNQSIDLSKPLLRVWVEIHMNSYNGFSPSQRVKAQNWLNKKWASGTLVRPTKCCACGQTEGLIDAHAEDYSEPFEAGKTDKFHLCRKCHMQVHRRFANPRSWLSYKELVKKSVTGRVDIEHDVLDKIG